MMPSPAGFASKPPLDLINRSRLPHTHRQFRQLFRARESERLTRSDVRACHRRLYSRYDASVYSLRSTLKWFQWILEWFYYLDHSKNTWLIDDWLLYPTISWAKYYNTPDGSVIKAWFPAKRNVRIARDASTMLAYNLTQAVCLRWVRCVQTWRIARNATLFPHFIIFHNLSSDVTSASSLSVFKNRLKTYLFRRCYETDSELHFFFLVIIFPPEPWSLQ